MHRVVLNEQTQRNGGKAAVPQSREFLAKEDLKTLCTVHVLGCSLTIIIIKKLNKNIRISFKCCLLAPSQWQPERGAVSLKATPTDREVGNCWVGWVQQGRPLPARWVGASAVLQGMGRVLVVARPHSSSSVKRFIWGGMDSQFLHLLVESEC